MKIGTKSILYGVHCWFIHPWFVAMAWYKLFGFPWDPRLWVAFFVHDLGYWGKPNMDGPEGETHVVLGARIMNRLFDHGQVTESKTVSVAEGEKLLAAPGISWQYAGYSVGDTMTVVRSYPARYWHDFCLYHSRFYAKRDRQPVSQLCYADKLSICLMPAWLYLFQARLTHEIDEYMKLAEQRTAQGEPKYASMQLSTDDQHKWFYDVQEYIRRWVAEHKDGRDDTWTPTPR